MTRSASASRSIRHRAPWVRAIWLVPDNQFHQRSIAARPSSTIFALSITVSFFATMSNCSRPSTRWRSNHAVAHRWFGRSLPYLNDDMMFVGPVRRARTAGGFFSNEGEIMLRGRWTSSAEQPEKNTLIGNNKLLGAEMMGYTSDHFFSSNHVIYPLLRPAMENSSRCSSRHSWPMPCTASATRRQLWTISAHDHLLLQSKQARVVKPHSSAHFSVRYCQSATPDALETRLKSLADGSVRMACINHLEAVVGKVVPDATRYLSEATGPAAPIRKEVL
jgi:hypothetical protein